MMAVCLLVSSVVGLGVGIRGIRSRGKRVVGGREEGYYGLFSDRARADGLLFDLGTGRRATAAETKLMGPTWCRIISVPSHQDQSHARRIALEHGLAAWDSMAGLSLAANPPPSSPQHVMASHPNPRARAQTWSHPPSERSDDKVRSTSRSPIWSCKLASYRVVIVCLSVPHTPHRAPRTSRNRVSSSPIGFVAAQDEAGRV